ncbi:bifunctional adenosylcobinamide kinase/adenosylcobinamide-phosphate guanylyltransferase [Anaerobacillus sp. HL2]|nr:bifunctional adenosylcobinamide kinase/adenosylcobinamide-phosphate guanylyltransferase [Anaerobacillus sp. HL2]
MVLIDCLTILVANELFVDKDKWSDLVYQQEIIEQIIHFLGHLCKKIITIIVSNEILNGSLYYDKATLTYMRIDW